MMPDSLIAPATDDIFDSSILVVCDDRAALEFYREALTGRGYSVICEPDPARAARHLRDKRISVVFTDVSASGPPLPAALFAPEAAQAGIEFVAAGDARNTAPPQTAPPQTEWLARPFDRAQFLAAINSAFNVARLQRFRLEEMRALESSLVEFKSRTLAAISQFMARAQMGRNTPGPSAAPEAAGQMETPLQAFVEDEHRRAQLRGRILGPLALSHASWMLLLVLAEARFRQPELTVKSAAYSAELPLSSAIRKINEMCAQGLMEKSGDPSDARRSFVALTPAGLAFLTRYFSELAKASGRRLPSA